MNRTDERQGDDGGPAIATCLIVVIAIVLIFVPTACGMSIGIDLAPAFTKPI